MYRLVTLPPHSWFHSLRTMQALRESAQFVSSGHRPSGVVSKEVLPCHRRAFVPFSREYVLALVDGFCNLEIPARIIIRRKTVYSWILTLMDRPKAIILTEFGMSMEKWIQFQGDIQLGKRVSHAPSF